MTEKIIKKGSLVKINWPVDGWIIDGITRTGAMIQLNGKIGEVLDFDVEGRPYVLDNYWPEEVLDLQKEE